MLLSKVFILLIRKSYLDLGSRKKEYLAIYQDIVKRNLTLTGQLRYWKNLKTIKQTQQKATKIDRQSSNETYKNIIILSGNVALHHNIKSTICRGYVFS